MIKQLITTILVCFIIYSILSSTKKEVNEDFDIFSKVADAVTMIGRIITNLPTLISQGIEFSKYAYSAMQKIIKLMIEIAHFVSLIVLKMERCYHGYNEVKLETLQEINNIKNRLKQMRNNVYGCMNHRKHLQGINMSNYKETFKKYMNNCTFNLNSYLNEIKIYVSIFKKILMNAKLFALKYPTKEGESNKWCKDNFKKNASYKYYALNCNQCFNLLGIISRELNQIQTIDNLIVDQLAF